MDPTRFDALTRQLSDSRTRRGVLGGALAGILVRMLGATETEARRKSRKEHTAKTEAKPKRCDVGCASLKAQAKSACKKACKACGGNFDQVCPTDGPFGPTAFTCCPSGTFCVFGAGVCCTEGTEPCFKPDGSATCCAVGTFCDLTTGMCNPPAVCTAAAGCLGGICGLGCFCVSSVEGTGACVNAEFANCDAPPCDTSADCGAGGVCVDVTSDSCCQGVPSARVCFPAEGLCGAGTARAGTRRGAEVPRWHQ